MPVRILLADDDPALRRVLQFKLRKQGFDVTAVEDGAKALESLKESGFDLLLSDMKMPGLTGIELLELSKKVRPELEVILMTAYAEVSQAVQAVKLGAFDYLTKPFEDDQLFLAIEKAVKFKTLENENKTLKDQLNIKDKFGSMVGVSQPYKAMIELVRKIAPTEATVLITGESGTGKEMIAREIHFQSNRKDKPFIAINCTAIPKELIESELFGHVKGAFTGAIKDKRGKFVLAEGGTILLDEIGELSIDLQAKLLRVIQERTIEPVGSEETIEIDVRLLAATNIDLKEQILKGAFREDLFYRLNVIPLAIPPLRERLDDIPVLVKEFLKKYSPDQKVTFSPELLKSLKIFHWTGNIRELENLIERMVILRSSDNLSPDDLPEDFVSQKGTVKENSGANNLSFHETEKKMIVDALKKFSLNQSKASRYLKIPRHILVYRIKKYGINLDEL
ncbi:MAG: sigma-54 dependent transcriptional regulator [bacterium]